MTAAAVPVPARAASPRARHVPLALPWRLLRLELRRNAMPWLLPVLAVLMWYSPYRVSMEYAPVWQLRASVMLDHFLPLVAFAAGAGAWTGSRDARHRTTDLVTVTPRPGWERTLASLAATICWAMTAYLGLVAAVYGVTAAQATWGGPAWWPVAVGAASLTASCTLGFAAGAFFPNRLTVPLAALGAGFLALLGISHGTNPYAVLSGAGGIPVADVGVFHRFPPDQAIVQLMFLAGLSIAAVGALGLPAASGGRKLRQAAAVLATAGLAAASIAVGVTATARVGPNGVVIPALHDAGSDAPVPYSPVCAGPAGEVCVHPAFRGFLGQVRAALDPVLSEIAGLPGAPARAGQVATSDAGDAGAVISGVPPVFRFALPATSPSFIAGLEDTFVTTFIAGPGGAAGAGGAAAQQAVESALLTRAGGPGAGTSRQAVSGPAVSAAAARFAALPAAARHAWLVAHLAALRAGHITLEQLP